MKRQMYTSAQLDRIRNWIKENQKEIHTKFVVSPVVFSHGSPVLEDLAVRHWRWVMRGVDWIANLGKWGKGLNVKFNKSIGDIRDDIRDSWGCEDNAEQADKLLDLLFDLQNDPNNPLGVVILSGDIHTSGYSNIYSNYQRHAGRSSITHITSSSVAYAPFSWVLEAVYRFATKSVLLGKRGAYSSQISHHYCSRSVALLSLRPMRSEGDHQLKVKYYLEGFPEPQVLLFDLARTTHSENIRWVSQEKVSPKEYAPSAQLDVDALLALRAKEISEKLNWKESIVDTLKLFGLDSSLDARKRMAQRWGYDPNAGTISEMNIFLLEQMKLRIRENDGKVPAEIESSPS